MNWQTGNTSTASLLSNTSYNGTVVGDGQCGAWVTFFLDTLAAHGLRFQNSIQQMRPVIPDVADLHDRLMLVRNWSFECDPPDCSSPDPDYPYRNTGSPWPPFGQGPMIDGVLYTWTHVEVQSVGSVPGQNTSNPRSIFSNHSVAFINIMSTNPIFDPSYGLRYATIDAFDNSALHAHGYHGDVDGPGPGLYNFKTIEFSDGLDVQTHTYPPQ